MLKLTFMTWLCPNWTIEEIIAGAHRHGYQGVEFRVQAKQVHGVELDMDPGRIKAIRKSFADAGLETPCLATSLQFAIPDPARRAENVQLLCRYMELAQELGVPYIRVFAGLPECEAAGAIERLASGLQQALEKAAAPSVEVLLETHDWCSVSLRVARLLEKVSHPRLNALWDIMHPYRELETPAETYGRVGKWVKHLHIHDGIYREERTRIEICPLGDGEVPHREPMALLKKAGFTGHFAIEIIRKADPNPDLYLEQYARKFREYEAAL